jgi:hypothetical protein
MAEILSGRVACVAEPPHQSYLTDHVNYRFLLHCFIPFREVFNASEQSDHAFRYSQLAVDAA